MQTKDAATHDVSGQQKITMTRESFHHLGHRDVGFDAAIILEAFLISRCSNPWLHVDSENNHQWHFRHKQFFSWDHTSRQLQDKHVVWI